MKRILKKDSIRFVEEVKIGLRLMGAREIEDNQFHIDSAAGTLWVRIDTDNVYCYSVYCRFFEPKRARRFKCNTFNGKYNIHVSGTEDVDDVVEEVYKHIEITIDPIRLDKKLTKN